MGNIEIFERIATQYDTPEREQIAALTVDKIRTYLVAPGDKSLLDFGCGTGLLGLALSDDFHTVRLVDSAANMVECVAAKIQQQGVANATALCLNLEQEEQVLPKVDYIIVAQVLIHIKEIGPILEQLYASLNPAGHLLIIDFDKNEQVVSELVHNGFEVDKLQQQLQELGFEAVTSEVFYHGEKLFMNQDASLFIIDAVK